MLDLGRTFLQSVERSPNALALVDGDVQLTYAQWHRMILNVAVGLRELGFRLNFRENSIFGRSKERALERQKEKPRHHGGNVFQIQTD